MSKKRRARFSQASHIVGNRNPTREAEILSRPADSFKGDPVITALMTRLSAPDCTEVEAVRIGLALQAMIRGDAALLNNMDDPAVADTVHKIVENRARQDKAAERFEQDQQRFVEDVFNQAERIAPTGEKAQHVIAQGMQQYKNAAQIAQAKKVERRLRLTKRLENDPKILTHVAPVYERTTVAGVVGEVERPVILRIMDRAFQLEAGDHMLPKILADAYANWLRGQAENRERKNIMANGTINAFELARKQAALDAKYGSKGQTITVPSEV